MNTHPSGVLYVVATPIGNLEDLSARALAVLRECPLVAAERPAHTRKLFARHGIATELVALNDHNEETVSGRLLAHLQCGADAALVSDAGTPLVSDPGYTLVCACHAAAVRVSPVPGASAILAALSVAGLPAARFCFEGFLPPRATARRHRLEQLLHEQRTLVFYEAPHRLVGAVADMAQVFDGARRATLARELTKQYETVRRAPLAELAAWIASDPEQRKGEAVLIVEGSATPPPPPAPDSARVLDLLLPHLSVKQAAHIAAALSGRGRNALYREALKHRQARQRKPG